MIYIGIDPGAKGAMAVLSERHPPMLFAYHPEVYIQTLKTFKQEGEDCICCIEAVHSITGQGIASSFKFGQTYGWLLGVLDAIGIPYQPITPQKWKKEFGLNADKAASVEVCKRLYPGICLLRTELSRKDDDGIAEALLMATYAKRKF